SNFHRLFSDVQICKLLKLVIHTGQLAFYMLLRFRKMLSDPGNIEKYASMRRAPSCLDLAIDTAGDVIAGEQLGRSASIPVALRVAPSLFFRVRRLFLVKIRDVVEHESTAFTVAQNTPFAAHAFGD